MSESAPTPDVDVVGVALLAAEARARRRMVSRERAHSSRRPRCPMLATRVRALERDLRAFVRSVERCKIVALARRSARAAVARASVARPVVTLVKDDKRRSA